MRGVPNVTCTRGFVMTFSAFVTRLFLLPGFFEESLGTRLCETPPAHGTCRCYSLHTVNGETERVLFCFMQNLLSGYNKVSIKWPVDSLLRLLSDFSITQPWRCLLITVINISDVLMCQLRVRYFTT